MVRTLKIIESPKSCCAGVQQRLSPLSLRRSVKTSQFKPEKKQNRNQERGATTDLAQTPCQPSQHWHTYHQAQPSLPKYGPSIRCHLSQQHGPYTHTTEPLSPSSFSIPTLLPGIQSTIPRGERGRTIKKDVLGRTVHGTTIPSRLPRSCTKCS